MFMKLFFESLKKLD